MHREGVTEVGHNFAHLLRFIVEAYSVFIIKDRTAQIVEANRQIFSSSDRAYVFS